MSYQIKIPVFEGPMDLLLHLIEKSEVDIYNIPIALITGQYLDYLAQAEEIDLELTSEFLILACTLLSIKARMLLPKPAIGTETEEDPRRELVEKIIEYKEFKAKAEVLKEKERLQSQVFWREIDEVGLLRQFPPANPLGSLALEDLLTAYHQILRKIEKKGEVYAITRDEITLQEKIEHIKNLLFKKPVGLKLSQLIETDIYRADIIVTFLALLELVRQGIIHLKQDELFSDIYIFLKDSEGGQASDRSVS